MLSVCIPVFRFSIEHLVDELLQQVRRQEVPCEIILRDDCSGNGFADQFERYRSEPEIRVFINDTNQGRARIRNQLARDATHEYLLFLDCDASVPRYDFLERYLKMLPFNGVLYGGRDYSPERPDGNEYLLHWTYGTRKESIPPPDRNREPYRSFRSNNFLVPKEVILGIPFDTSLTGYGYEDNLWAADLRRAGIPILHIDNPVRHEGLETNIHYLEKTEEALDTLVKLYKKGRIPAVKILRKATRLRRWKLDLPLLSLWRGRLPRWRKKLATRGGPIRQYQYYRLGYLLMELRKI